MSKSFRSVTSALGALSHLGSRAWEKRPRAAPYAPPPMCRTSRQRLFLAAPHDPVLIVDDDEINLVYASEEVEIQGYPYEVARDGQEAFEALQVGNFRLVLMDCQMPVMDGFAASREVRRWERERTTRVPIVALTGHDDDREREKAQAAGMDDFLVKPLKARDLRRVMDQFPGGRRAIVWPPPPPDLTPGVRRSPRLIELFLQHVPGQLVALRAACDARDGDALAHEAHKLKGTCLAIAAEPMAQIAEQLRACANSGDLTLVGGLLAELDIKYQSVESLVRWEIRTG